MGWHGRTWSLSKCCITCLMCCSWASSLALSRRSCAAWRSWRQTKEDQRPSTRMSPSSWSATRLSNNCFASCSSFCVDCVETFFDHRCVLIPHIKLLRTTYVKVWLELPAILYLVLWIDLFFCYEHMCSKIIALLAGPVSINYRIVSSFQSLSFPYFW